MVVFFESLETSALKPIPDTEFLASVGGNCYTWGREKLRCSIFDFELPKTCECLLSQILAGLFQAAGRRCYLKQRDLAC